MTQTPHEQTIHAYIAAFDAGDPGAAAALFAADATLEDPVGGEILRGHDAIALFYSHAMTMGAKLHLNGPVRQAADSAAFAFTVEVNAPGQRMEIDVIDVFRFNPDGKVIEMRAFWGPTNVRMIS